MTQLVLGTNTAGAARSYFSSTAYFNRHSRKGGADPFLQISPSSVHNSGSSTSTCRMKDGIVWLE